MSRALFLAIIMIFTAVPAAAESEPFQAESLFEEVWSTLDSGYALFGVKSVDWDALHDIYRLQISSDTSEAELFTILTTMLGHLNDTHVMLIAESLGRDFSAGNLGVYFRELGFAGALAKLADRPLPEHYFKAPPRVSEDSVFLTGWVGEGIGYIHFGAFNDSQGSADNIDRILSEFSEARALIVDVRNNSGGDDQVGKAIADRFADRRRLYMVTRDRKGPRHDDFAEARYWHLEPAAQTFTQPVVLLINRFSVSAA
jgi:carboxyl-terminal processing protease